MELLDTILTVTRCTHAEQLKSLSAERKMNLANSIEETVPPGLATLAEWNELLQCFVGGCPESDNAVAKEKLLSFLRGEA